MSDIKRNKNSFTHKKTLATRRVSRREIRPLLQRSTSTATSSDGVIKVMLVDDSSMMRKVITRILHKSPRIKVVAEAANGKQALDAIPQVKPDVITLDVNMPIMDGVTALKHIIVEHHLPVLMLSAFTEEGAGITFDCLTYGAVDFICKPARDEQNLEQKENEIIEKVTKACQVQIETLNRLRLPKRNKQKKDTLLTQKSAASKIITAGAGAGGYSGYLRVLPHLPEQFSAAILAVQYMDDNYFDTFCNYLNQYSRLIVKRAEDGEILREGVCYFANQSQFMELECTDNGYICKLSKNSLGKREIFDRLLISACQKYKGKNITAIFSGRGIDGIQGIERIKTQDSLVFAQAPHNCIMPMLSEAAIKSGKVDRILNTTFFPGVLWHLCKDTDAYIICPPFEPVKLDKSKPFRIGRDEGNDMILPSREVSRYHAIIEWEGQWLLSDLQSANGTFVNDEKIESQVLQTEDRVSFGYNTIIFRCIANGEQNEKLTHDSLDDDTVMLASEKVHQELQPRSFNGDLQSIELAPILQILGMDGRSGCLHVYREQGEAFIYLQEGQLTHCRYLEIAGRKAFFEIMSFRSGKFEFEGNVTSPELTMSDNIDMMLLEFARQTDEATR